MNEVVRALLDGNADHAARVGDAFDDLQLGQRPSAVTVCCSDSRVLQDHIWGGTRPGEVFTCSTIGNRVQQRTPEGTVVAGDVLYPLHHTGTGTVVVVGHTGCGAVTAAYDAIRDEIDEPPGIAHCIDLLADHLADGVDRLPDGLDHARCVNRLVEYNVDQQVAALRVSDDVPGDVTVVGCVYDFQDIYGAKRGRVHLINADGERDPAALRDANPEIADRIARQWVY
jgi:carbonic anhydrase